MTLLTPDNLSPTTHTITAHYFGDENYSVTDASSSFTVQQQTLPTPTITAAMRTHIPAGETSIINVSNTCGTNCGDFAYYVDGTFAGGNSFDGWGNSQMVIYPSWGVGTHVLTLSYNGNANFSPAQLTPISIGVLTPVLPMLWGRTTIKCSDQEIIR